jgi:hypothetical protein
MPPTRTMPPAKAVKVCQSTFYRCIAKTNIWQTERTHEENQERAYIAASRRSDRSLEARVESARRASEIHKRRTGRSLRVTEQDVVNEEMYEEEDDDTPYQFRRLNAHLTHAYPQNDRLAAYLATNVSMRNMVQQAVHDSYNQQYGIPASGQQFNQPQMYPQPNPMAGSQPLGTRHPQSIPSHRQAPYSSPRPPTSQSSHSRSASIATPREFAGNVPISPVDQMSNDRRMSMPAVAAVSAGSPIDSLTPGSATPGSASSSQSAQRPSFSSGSFSQNQAPQQQQGPPPLMRSFSGLGPSNNGQNYGPFTTALPQDSQMFFGPDFNMNNLNMMTVNNNFSNSNWNLGSAMPGTMATENQQQSHPTFGGLNATLAPSALDSNKQSNLDVMTQPSQYTGTEHFDDIFFGQQSTPGPKLEENADWENFMNWGDLPASQQSQSST